MKNQSHTPGPWVRKGTPTTIRIEAAVPMPGGTVEKRTVATVEWNSGTAMTNDEYEANGRLLIYAPDTYACLCRLLAAVERVDGLGGPLGRGIKAEAYAIIAKVDGKAVES